MSKAAGSLSVSPTTMTVKEGATGSITVTRAGDGTISAISSDTAVATVSVSGTTVTVTGKAAGTATITVSVTAGTNHYAPPSKTTDVSVVTPLGSLPVGSIIALNENGTPAEYIIVHQGLPTSIFISYDSSCDGTWLLRKDIYEKRVWDSSSKNDYANSTIHSYLNSTFLSMFDANIQSAIKQVKIPYRVGSGALNDIASGANGLAAKIFLLSSREVNAFDYSGRVPHDGIVLSYFSECAAQGEEIKRVAYLNGTTPADWWLRSPSCDYRYGDTQVLYIMFDTGKMTHDYCGMQSYGIRPALVMPSDLCVTSDGFVCGE